MPVLTLRRAEKLDWEDRGAGFANDWSQQATGGESSIHGPLGGLRSARMGWLETCANPACGSGWLHLWRSRSAPIFEGGWSCSAECTQMRVGSAVRRELEGRVRAPEAHRHRIPLG